MTDIPTQVVKTPIVSAFLPMAMTGVVSGSMGDKVGDAISEIVAWIIALKCNCVPPEKVISGVHTLCIVGVMILAYSIHYLLIKSRQPQGE